MIRVTKELQTDGSVKYCEFAGLSTDEKPTEKVATGSLFLEVDTGAIFAFDEEGEEWNSISGGD